MITPEENASSPAPSARRIHWIVAGMLLLGLPIAALVYLYPIAGHAGSSVWHVRIIGGLVWLSWHWRLFWSAMPNHVRIMLWSVSIIWHLVFIPLFPFAFMGPMSLYLMLHCLLVLALSVQLVQVDRLRPHE